MSRTNETSHIEWHGTCKCKCGLDARVCNNKKVGIMINGDVIVKNLLAKEYVMKDSFRIQVTVNVNVINHDIGE